MADACLAIADEVATAETSEAVNAARLRVDTRKWYLSKLAPKRYGDRAQVALTDAEGNATGFMFGIIGAPKQIEDK